MINTLRISKRVDLLREQQPNARTSSPLVDPIREAPLNKWFHGYIRPPDCFGTPVVVTSIRKSEHGHARVVSTHMSLRGQAVILTTLNYKTQTQLFYFESKKILSIRNHKG